MSVRPFVRAEALARVLKITTEKESGTAFTVDRAGRQWLITAKHLLPDWQYTPECRVEGSAGSQTLRLPFLADFGQSIDLAVAPLDTNLTQDLELHATSEGLGWSQEVFFLGFPLGITPLMLGGLPFVKAARVGGRMRSADNVSMWLLDGRSNPGFSGGPVVANTTKFETMQVVGIVSGSLAQGRALELDDVQVAGARVREDTGIIIATDISHATTLIDANA